MRPLNEMIRIFAEQADEQMTMNFKTQRIWPYEVYPGYAEVNRKRKKNGQWYSTGRGLETFRIFAANSSDIWHAEIDAVFLDYMRYVDVGAGIGRIAEDVDRSRKANFARRYNKWQVQERRTSRPALMMEMRHILSRMRDYAADFYGYEGTGYIIKTFEELEPTLQNQQ